MTIAVERPCWEASPFFIGCAAIPAIGFSISYFARRGLDKKAHHFTFLKLKALKRDYFLAGVAMNSFSALIVTASLVVGVFQNVTLPILSIGWYVGFAIWNLRTVHRMNQEIQHGHFCNQAILANAIAADP